MKNVRVNENDVITVQLWDTAGQERFRSIATSYFRKADGVILMYDVTCPSSFINVRDWMDRILVSAKRKLNALFFIFFLMGGFFNFRIV